MLIMLFSLYKLYTTIHKKIHEDMKNKPPCILPVGFSKPLQPTNQPVNKL